MYIIPNFKNIVNNYLQKFIISLYIFSTILSTFTLEVFLFFMTSFISHDVIPNMEAFPTSIVKKFVAEAGSIPLLGLNFILPKFFLLPIPESIATIFYLHFQT